MNKQENTLQHSSLPRRQEGVGGSAWFRGSLFPRFPRIFTATILPFVAKTTLWSVFTALAIINVYARVNLIPSYWTTLLTSLRFPVSPPAHQALAEAYWQQGYVTQAKKELLYAQDVINSTRGVNGQTVLGTSTAPNDLLTQWEQEPEKLRRQYQFWQTVVREKPDYRDGYIMLASLAYQLRKLDEARSSLARAQALDSNSSTVQELTKIFK